MRTFETRIDFKWPTVSVCACCCVMSPSCWINTNNESSSVDRTSRIDSVRLQVATDDVPFRLPANAAKRTFVLAGVEKAARRILLVVPSVDLAVGEKEHVSSAAECEGTKVARGVATRENGLDLGTILELYVVERLKIIVR